LGSVLLEGLISEPRFNVSVLVRESSKSLGSLPATIAKVFKVPNDYPHDSILEAFKNQDAVVSAITSAQVEEQFKFVDAAIEAGVKRYVASEYGLNNSRPEARALSAVFDSKGKLQEYLRSKESTGLTWHAIGCGMWIDWSLKNNFLGLDYANKTITFADEGKGKFSTSTMSNTALALKQSLLNPQLTANKVVYISDFATSQSELVATIEKVSGVSWTRKNVDSIAAVEEYKRKVDEGDIMSIYKLVELGFVAGRYGAWLEENERLWNEQLGLPKAQIDEVVKCAVEKMK
jgi:hypothetical protein